jgi:hypothetical protein
MISILLEDENKNANEKIQDLSALVRSQVIIDIPACNQFFIYSLLL